MTFRLAAALWLALAALAPGAAAAAPPRAPATSTTVQEETTALLSEIAKDWARMQQADGVFPNPFAADAVAHPPFSPPPLTYGLLRQGARDRDAAVLHAAHRALPLSVSAKNASTFDMVAAAYAYRAPGLPRDLRDWLADYMSRYGIPHNGQGCFVRPGCWHNLVLVDALAVLAITNNGIASPRPEDRMYDTATVRAAAADVVNRRIPALVDHRLRASGPFGQMRGTLLSDPNRNQLAYHALCTFMLGQAVRELGPDASAAAVQVLRETLDSLAVLVAPDGDMSYMGRGQAQVWVPALTAGAMMEGARLLAVTDPTRAGRYLAVAQRAVERLRTRHLYASGLQLVPGAATRATTNGIDDYANTVAYNGLAMFGLAVAADAGAELPPLAAGTMPADRALAVTDSARSGMGVVADGQTWMAVHRHTPKGSDMRYDFGLLALKRRGLGGWHDVLAPRPLTKPRGRHPRSAGPNLVVRGRPIIPHGVRLRSTDGRLTARGGWRRSGRWVRRATFAWTLRRNGGARLTVRGLHAGDRLVLLAFTPAGTGRRVGRNAVMAGGTPWRLSVPVKVRRTPGYHSGPVEDLDALELHVRAGKRPLTVDVG
jgi:hypothetical protein